MALFLPAIFLLLHMNKRNSVVSALFYISTYPIHFTQIILQQQIGTETLMASLNAEHSKEMPLAHLNSKSIIPTGRRTVTAFF